MTLSLASFQKGHRFEPAEFDLSGEWVRGYIEAVEDQAISGVGPYAPPISLAALAIRALMEQTPLPSGSVHAGQELSFARPALIGERLSARAEVLTRGERQGWVMMGLGLRVVDAFGEVIMHGRATVTFPVDPEAGY